jgi:hypothetical protein
MNPVVVRAEIIDMITLWLAGAAMTAPKMILFTNNPVLSPDTVLADLVQPTASWYVPPTQAVTGPVDVGGLEQLACLIPSHVWAYTGVDPACTVIGWGLTDTAGANLLLVANLDVPVLMSTLLDRCVTPASYILWPRISA